MYKKNSSNYKEYRQAYLIKIKNDTLHDKYPNYTSDMILTLKHDYQKNLELTYFVGIILYVANIVDASVDAHLFNFDVSDKLSLNVKPLIYQNNYSIMPTMGMTFAFKFK